MSALSQDKRAVPRAFDRVAATYDRLTGMNPGYHRHLRLSASRLSVRSSRPRLLDLCCGTGASTEALERRSPTRPSSASTPRRGMLGARAKPSLRGVTFVEGTRPTRAPSSRPFDGILMAYGIRNLAEPDRALRNLRALLIAEGHHRLRRVLRRRRGLAKKLLWDAICWSVIIPGGLLTARGNRYRYLRTSVRDFDEVRAFEARRSGARASSTEQARWTDGSGASSTPSWRGRREPARRMGFGPRELRGPPEGTRELDDGTTAIVVGGGISRQASRRPALAERGVKVVARARGGHLGGRASAWTEDAARRDALPDGARLPRSSGSTTTSATSCGGSTRPG
ncbi:MAG: class I SAM-dependent methyltransferase [Sandaracinaceae bacterium]